jgi:5-methylcytosine-specific restriction endonuclease McrA
VSNILDQLKCVKLNSLWQPVALRTVREALTDLTSISPDEERTALAENREPQTAALGLDLAFDMNEDGTVDYSHPTSTTPTEWEDWVNLPIRPYDDLVITSSRGDIRVPTMLIARNFRKMPERKYSPSRRGIKERDQGICQVTRRFVGDNGNLGHVIAKSKGGKITWTNAVWLDPKINTLMGDRTPEEAGMRLIRKPVEPKPVPLMIDIARGGAKHPSWEWVIKDLV